MRNVMRLLLAALETALAGGRRDSPVAATVSTLLTVAALGAALWILSAAPLDGPAALIAAGAAALPAAPPLPFAAALPPPPPLPFAAALPPAGASGVPIWPWLLAAVIVGMVGRRPRRRRRLRRVGAELPLLAARWRQAAAARRAFLRERARRRAEEARDGAR